MDISTLTLLIIILVLAAIVGYHVVWGVTPALHTPLMAVTNAISGVVVVAAILIAGQGEVSALVQSYMPNATFGARDENLIFYGKILGFLGVTLASINIFGGFAITNRMLAMFKSRNQKSEIRSQEKK